MNTIAVGLALASFVVVSGFVVRYLHTIPRGKVPVSVTPFASQLEARSDREYSVRYESGGR